VTLSSRLWAVLASVVVLALGVAACGDDDDEGGNGGGGGAASNLSGSIRIDGSSTVGPLTEAVVQGFNEENPDVQITVGQAGTGGGFEKFCAGETDINDASRPIEPEEVSLCKQGGVKHEEVVVANDALTVVLNPNNPVTCLTIDQLSQIWGPENTASSWSDVRDLDAEFDAEIQRFGPGTDSGTFDYFTEEVNGEEGVQTKDYNNVGEDDNQTVVGVQGSEGGIGYFGYSYFQENQEGLKAAEIENDKGQCVAPSEESVQAGDYTPLGRELFIYPSQQALAKPEVKAFVDYYLANVNDIASEIGFIGLTPEQLSKSEAAVEKLG
jgi:phosphate transport system substrate-binding protein